MRSILYRYAVTVLNSTANTAIGGPLLANFIAAYGNGSIADTVSNTTNPLESDIIFVGDMNNRTVSFPQGFTSGLTPTNGTGSIIFQQLGDGTFLWSLEIASKSYILTICIHIGSCDICHLLLLSVLPLQSCKSHRCWNCAILLTWTINHWF